MKLIQLVVLLALVSCQHNSRTKDQNYTLVTDAQGVVVEQFDAANTDENRFNLNDRIYTIGREFTYNYEYLSESGKKLLFKWNSRGWEFVIPQSNDPKIITQIKIKVASGLKPLIGQIPEYNQTILSYQLVPQVNFSFSGAIENEANVWIHPPREALFRILGLNPFPYVKYPLEVGNRWSWQLEVGDEWADERWILWTGLIKFHHQYEIKQVEERETSWGRLKCYLIEATGKSRLGETHLTALFNEKLGFIALNYSNIDGSSIKMTLIEVSGYVRKL